MRVESLQQKGEWKTRQLWLIISNCTPCKWCSDDHRITGWPGLKRTCKISSFNPLGDAFNVPQSAVVRQPFLSRFCLDSRIAQKAEAAYHFIIVAHVSKKIYLPIPRGRQPHARMKLPRVGKNPQRNKVRSKLENETATTEKPTATCRPHLTWRITLLKTLLRIEREILRQ